MYWSCERFTGAIRKSRLSRKHEITKTDRIVDRNLDLHDITGNFKFQPLQLNSVFGGGEKGLNIGGLRMPFERGYIRLRIKMVVGKCFHRGQIELVFKRARELSKKSIRVTQCAKREHAEFTVAPGFAART